MVCPLCNEPCAGIFDSRPAPGNTVKRRRVCFACGWRWTTYEVGADFLEAARALGDMAGKLQDLPAYVAGLVDGIDPILNRLTKLRDLQGIGDE